MLHALGQLLVDLLSALVFVLVFALTKDLMIATGSAIAVALLQAGFAIMRKRAVSRMQWLGLGLAVALGLLTLITSDSRFVRMKPSIAHVAVGVVMLKRGWQLPYLPPRVREWVPERMLLGWGYAWSVLMFAMALVNLAAAQWLSVGAWGLVVIGLMVGKFAFFLAQYVVLRVTVRSKMRVAEGV
jgi:intracellular septation protein